jgi:hypothetical protein
VLEASQSIDRYPGDVFVDENAHRSKGDFERCDLLLGQARGIVE